MRAYERLLKYVKIYTTSSDESGTVPSTERQFDLARLLVDELKALGAADAYVDGKCYVYAHLPATEGCESATPIGFIAHLDTAPDFCGKDVNPHIIENYDGKDVSLGESGRVLKVSDFPHLSKLSGRTLIVTDGTTLLGADNKAGIAEIMTLVEHFTSTGAPHGPISVCFTPDEEIGSGADNFDLDAFGAKYAYTVDGGEEGEVVYENFNACSAKFEISGVNIHPGEAKNRMVNAQLVAMEINASLPAGDIPSHTEGYEGFFHLCNMSGSVESATLYYIVRDHDEKKFEERKQLLQNIESQINSKYGEGTVKLTICEQYRNMKEKILPCYEIIENALAATKEAGIEPLICPIRGGTDGARLSFMGLPCPNLGTGGYAFHGPFEHITAEGMDKAVEILIGIVGKFFR